MFDREPTKPTLAGRVLGALGLVLFVLVGGTLLFFLLHPKGAEDRIRDAADLLAGGNPKEAVRLLDQAERALVSRRDPVLLARIYDLRSRAYLRVGNLALAQKDLESLLKVTKDPAKRGEYKIRLAERVHLGRAARAVKRGDLDGAGREIQKAVTILESLPGDLPPRLETLAKEALGRASQRAYQSILKRIQDRLSLLVPGKVLLQVQPLILKLIFHRREDPRARALSSEAKKLLAAAEVPLSTREWVERKIGEARDWVQKAFRNYGEALDLEGTFAAFQGVTGLLALAGRPDEAAMASRTALAAGGPLYRARAAQRLGELQRRAGRESMAEETLLAWFRGDPPQRIWKRWRTIPPAVEDAWILLLDLLTVRRREPVLNDTFQQVLSLWRHFPPRFAELSPFYSGMNAFISGWEPKSYVRDLENFTRSHGERPAEWIDRYRLAQEALVEGALKRKDPKKALLYLRQWVDQRPWDVTPRLRRAALLEEEGKFDEALLDYRQAYRVKPSDEILEKLWAARKTILDRRGHTVEATARKLFAEGNLLAKELVHPHLHLELARYFLERGMGEPALFHAREARILYPDSPAVELLLAKARILAGRLEEARTALETSRTNHPGDPRILSLLAEIYAREGKDDPGLDLDLVSAGGTPRAFRIFARGLLAMERPGQALQVVLRGLDRFGKEDPELNLLAGKALRTLGRLRRAADHFAAVPRGSAPYWESRYLLLQVRLETRDGKGLEDSVREYLAADAPPGEVFRAARLLYRAGRNRAALRLAGRLSDSPKALSSLGRGKVFLLRARCLYKSGRPEQAALEAERALAFPDGKEAALFLVPYYVSRGRTRDAGEILSLQEGLFPPLDEATLLALTGHLKKAREKGASLFLDPPKGLWGRARLRALAFFLGEGKNRAPSTGDPGLDELCARWCRPLLETLFFLDRPDFQGEALKTLEALPPKEKEKPWARVILDRARLAAGLRDDALRDLGLLLAQNPKMDEPWRILLDFSRQVEKGRDLFFKTALYLENLFPLWQARVAAGGLKDLDFLSKVVHIFSQWLRNLAHGAEKIGDKAGAERFLSLARFFLQAESVLLEKAGKGAPLATAQELLAAGDKLGAARLLERAISRTSGREHLLVIDAFFQVARDLLPGFRDEARRAARPLVEDPHGPSGPALHFLIATEDVPLEEAVARYLPLLQKHIERVRRMPVNTPDFLWAGSTARLIARVRPSEAVKAARELLLRDPASWEAWEATGMAFEALGEWKKARKAFSVGDLYMSHSPLLAREVDFLGRNDLPGMPGPEALSGLAPNQPLPRRALALWHLRRGEFRKALDLLERAGCGGPEEDFFRARAALFLDPPAWKEAGTCLARLLEKHPGHPRARYAGLILRLVRRAGEKVRPGSTPASPPGEGK